MILDRMEVLLADAHTIRHIYICLIDYLDVFNTLSIYEVTQEFPRYDLEYAI